MEPDGGLGRLRVYRGVPTYTLQPYAVRMWILCFDLCGSVLTPSPPRRFECTRPVRRGTVRRLPRPPPWSPGDDRWLPGTARGRGTFASVTLRRDPTDLFKFGAAGGQADGSPKKSFKIGKH